MTSEELEHLIRGRASQETTNTGNYNHVIKKRTKNGSCQEGGGGAKCEFSEVEKCQSSQLKSIMRVTMDDGKRRRFEIGGFESNAAQEVIDLRVDFDFVLICEYGE